MAISLLIADDQALVRRGFRLLLEIEEDLEIVGEAADGREAVEQARRVRPDVVLMDVRMPGTGGIEACRRLHAARPETRILMLTMSDDEGEGWRPIARHLPEIYSVVAAPL